MDFSFTEEQTLLRDTVASYLADTYDFEKRRAAVASPAGWRPEVWKAFAEELGILGASFSEEQGGLGGGPTEVMVVAEEFGKALVIEPYLGTVVIGGGFLRRAGGPLANELIGQIISGEARFAFAWAEPQARYCLNDIAVTAKMDGAGWVLNGAKAVVVGAPFATHLIVTARTGGSRRDTSGISVFVVEKGAKGVNARDYPTVDGNRAAEIEFENVAVRGEALLGAAGEALPTIEAVVDEAIAATCAEACGVLRKLHEGTLEYTRQRKQFGAPIASFQVLQHRMVDMFMAFEQAVSAAKVQIGRACRFVGQNAIQLHGGMGMTDEMAIGHYFKRATLIEGLFGSVDHHLARYEALSFAKAA